MGRFVAGSMLIEVILGFGIAIMGLTAIMQLSSRSVGTSGSAIRNSQATRFADEGLDWVKGQHVLLGWTGFLEKSSDSGTEYCLNNLDWTSGCAVSTVQNTEFVRRLYMSRQLDAATNKILVKALIEVTWNEGQRLAKVSRVFQFVPY